MKRILITGGSGFIARNIVEQLGRKYTFVTAIHKQLDLLDAKAIEQMFYKNKYFDLVIHTAIVGGNRKTGDAPSFAIDNLRMFFNLVKNRRHFDRMISIGSGSEYGRQRSLRLVKEEDFDKWIPEDNFGFYKYLVAKFIENTKGIINLRVFGIWGKYEDHTIRFISNAICKNILGMPITINQNVFFDYLYIDDFVKILDYFINHEGKYKSYNVGVGRGIDLLTIAHKINEISGTKSQILVRHRGLAHEYTCNNKRLVAEIGKFKFRDFDDALGELYKWYQDRKFKLKKSDLANDYFN